MKTTTSLSLSILLAMLALCPLNAQQVGGDITFLGSVGIVGASSLTSHSLDIRSLPGVPSCCPQYKNGTGAGFTLGALYELPVNSAMTLEIKGMFTRKTGTITALETKLIYDGKGSADGIFEHTIDATLTKIELVPTLRYKITGGLKALAGGSIGLASGATYAQQERLITSSNVLFENDSRSRLQSSGIISGTAAFQAEIHAGLSYNVPLNSNATWIASPQATYSFGITNILQNEKWNVNSLNFGIAIRYAWYKYPELITPSIDKIELSEPVIALDPMQQSTISGSVRSQFVDESGSPAKGQVLDIKNITSTNVSALVNYVFFDDTSAVIPARYTLLDKAQAADFILKDLEGTGTLPIYYHILNVIGKRMQLYPESGITLTGCASGGENEKDKPQLPKQRAEVLKNYLTDVWGIDAKRITFKSRTLPEVASNVKNEDGLAENRRVEITSKSWELLDVLSFNDTLRQLSSPIIALNAEAKADNGIASWRITATQDRKKLKEFIGTSSPAGEKLLWDLREDPNSVPKLSEPVNITMDITDKDGRTEVIKCQPIRIKQLYDQKERIETFSLIIFGFNMSSVNEANQRIIDLIKSRIAKNSIVTVTGFTDRTGAAEYNQKLSDRRAKEIGKLLNVREERSTGKGGSELLYDNNLPEGRFYSRTVRVTIETPIE
jgi:outer membrane protein OmpA-like peptidoglycan-associated protein